MINTQDSTNERQGIRRQGRVSALLLWLLGVPIPIILLILLIRGCMA